MSKYEGAYHISQSQGSLHTARDCLTIIKLWISAKTANLAWAMGDVGVGLMAWLNIVGILIIFFMSKPALKALADYEEQQKQGVTEYTFNPVKLGIKGATYWEEKYKRKTGKSPEAEAERVPRPHQISLWLDLSLRRRLPSWLAPLSDMLLLTVLEVLLCFLLL